MTKEEGALITVTSHNLVYNAWVAWCQRKNTRLEITVTDRFVDAHTLERVSKSTTIQASIEQRYKEQPQIRLNNVGASRSLSWMEYDPYTLETKLQGGIKQARVFLDRQQLAIQIPVIRRSVTILRINQAKYESSKPSGVRVKVQLNLEPHYLLCTSEGQKKVKFIGVGNWDPASGTAQMYHYEEDNSFPTSQELVTHVLLDKYREWYVNPDKKKENLVKEDLWYPKVRS